jgi:hypothetical protein
VQNGRVYYSDGMDEGYEPNLFTKAFAVLTLGLYIGVPQIILALAALAFWHSWARLALLAVAASAFAPLRPLAWRSVLSSYVFLAWRRYFRFSFVFDESLNAYKDYVIAQFPHGAFPVGGRALSGCSGRGGGCVQGLGLRRGAAGVGARACCARATKRQASAAAHPAPSASPLVSPPLQMGSLLSGTFMATEYPGALLGMGGRNGEAGGRLAAWTVPRAASRGQRGGRARPGRAPGPRGAEGRSHLKRRTRPDAPPLLGQDCNFAPTPSLETATSKPCPTPPTLNPTPKTPKPHPQPPPEYNCYALAANNSFLVPVWRHVHTWLGTMAATERNFRRLLALGTRVGLRAAAKAERRAAAKAAAGGGDGDDAAAAGGGSGASSDSGASPDGSSAGAAAAPLPVGAAADGSPPRRTRVVRRNPQGVSIGVMVGGIAEMYLLHPDYEQIKLMDRKGFIRMAVEHGAELLPVYMFGVSKMMSFGPPWLMDVGRRMRMSIGVMYGLWGTPVPRRVPLRMAVGLPISVGPAMPRSDPRFEAHVEAMHAAMVEGVRAVYYKHRAAYGWADRPLVIV